VLEIAIGLVLIGVAWWLRRPRPHSAEAPAAESRTARYLQSRRLVLLLGVVLYVIPSPIYLAAIKSIVDGTASTSAQVATLAAVVVVMLWMIELPMIALLLFPGGALALLDRINAYLTRHGRSLLALVSLAVGAYLLIAGLVRLG
jgi:hypothetical protein